MRVPLAISLSLMLQVGNPNHRLWRDAGPPEILRLIGDEIWMSEGIETLRLPERGALRVGSLLARGHRSSSGAFLSLSLYP